MTTLTVTIVVVSGLIGLVIGAFLNVAADRVSAVSPPGRGRLPRRCHAPVTLGQRLPVVAWAAHRGSCPACGARIPGRYPAVEAITGLAFAGVTWWSLPSASPRQPADIWASAIVTIAFLFFAAICILLTLIDVASHRLPNSIVLPSYPVALSLFTIAAVLAGRADSLQRAVIGMACLAAFYFAMRLVRRAGMGGGDVKLAGVIGLYLGWAGWGALIVGALAAFVYGGLFGVALLIRGRARLQTAIPFGPWMILGAWTGLLIGEALWSWYTVPFTTL